jgi:hypothetical protein
MISNDVWGYETDVDEKNLCAGSLLREKAKI